MGRDETRLTAAQIEYLRAPTHYSCERFDRYQEVALALTDSDRLAGRDAPRYGYSAANFRAALEASR
jgi:hypothetical protein